MSDFSKLLYHIGTKIDNSKETQTIYDLNIKIY